MKIRVLHAGKYYPPYKGGIETLLFNVFKGLGTRTLLTIAVSNIKAVTEEERAGDARIIRLARVLNIFSTPICPGFLRIFRRDEYDILHLHLPNPFAVIMYLLSGSRAKLVVSYHSEIIRQKFIRILVGPFTRKLLKKAEAVIVPTENHINNSEILSGFRDKCLIIPYGIDTKSFSLVSPEERILIEGLKKDHGERIVLFTGRLVYYKGVEYLIRAMDKIDGKLLIAGTGPLERKLKSMAGKEKVIFLGEVDDKYLKALYYAASVFVLPAVSESEAFGLVQLEAMACGKPVISTDLPTGIKLVNRDGITGFTVPPRDQDALSDKISYLLDNTQAREKMGRAGRQAAEGYSIENMADGFYDLYKRILDKQVICMK